MFPAFGCDISSLWGFFIQRYAVVLPFARWIARFFDSFCFSMAQHEAQAESAFPLFFIMLRLDNNRMEVRTKGSVCVPGFTLTNNWTKILPRATAEV